VTQIQLHNGLS